MNIEHIQKEIESLRQELKSHRLYEQLETIEDIKIFTQDHVFAVWDFMSLLKALQIELTCVSIPWVPRKKGKLTQFINEIALAEESDVDLSGESKSHFEMYLDAMGRMGSDTQKIEIFMSKITQNMPVSEALDFAEVPDAVKSFVKVTFDTIYSNDAHKIASAFTFGREDLIPDMFIEIIQQTHEQASFKDFLYYLNRHVELDGDSHGPLSLEMIVELCGDDQQKWSEVLATAKASLEVRISLWDYIADTISNHKLEK
ncbi:DUF3050 domain-containing protein [Flavobacteriaceae bacterium]|jgi:hypothetical protein|nr:DUF3050 domain-containing protein [Flavobacteriaceae bacterium]MDB2336722.1 DUF3050 domain-containing protein [Flavobacteriaceae bacterium]MDB2657712.1 DUF3050 domain-containing protein [Flavobacteriaceae bacterium]MDB2661091.1 DUF3050 domain-containing protein [Flavobacteriaceae bacterium]MDB2674574.1 DUF3050 domain-containing protein [Flavobacteriaceae bacterium]|tara:strand:- start:83 stop:856 length:774 start_codon:yes stop_codon:yes gene_type:complete